MTDPIVFEVDDDGAAATERAVVREGRSAVWVGGQHDPELDEFRRELCR